MNDTALLITIAYSVVVVLGVIVAWIVWRSTRRPEPVDTEKLAERERTWLFVVVALLLGLLLATIFAVPYGKGAGDARTTVDVKGAQFAWEINPQTIPAGEPVEFRIEAADVNHGFGVYDPDHTFVFQVQAMPGRVQRITHTFERPGTYEVLCLEFCGVLHHRMIGRFEVRG